MTETISFSKIEPYKGKSYILNAPLVASIVNKPLSDGSDFWVVMAGFADGLTDITGWGKTRDEAISNFHSDFHMVYTDIGCEDDKNLTEDARELKKRILEMVDA